jgi:hypothetical protein
MVILMSQQIFSNRPLEERRQFVRLITQRMLQAYKFDDSRELAVAFNCTHGAIKNWRSAGRVPLDSMFQCHLETGVSMDWILYGENPKEVYTPSQVKKLVSHIDKELEVGIRYKLIESIRDDGLRILSDGMSEGLLKYMGIKVSDDDAGSD